jgi:hypothetical protein
MPGDDLIGQEHATSVDVEIDVPFVVGQLKHMLHRRNARIGHENLASPNCPRACLNPRSTEARSTSTKRCRRRFRSLFDGLPQCPGRRWLCGRRTLRAPSRSRAASVPANIVCAQSISTDSKAKKGAFVCQDRVRAEPPLVRRAVEIEQHAVDLHLLAGILADKRVANFALHIRNRPSYALTVKARFVVVAQFHGFMRTGRSSGRDSRAAFRLPYPTPRPPRP